MERWKKDKIDAWFEKQPYFVGANFTPSTAINQLEMWQVESFDPATIDRELGYAASVGMNMMRVYLHDLLWEQDRDGFISRIDRYLKCNVGAINWGLVAGKTQTIYPWGWSKEKGEPDILFHDVFSPDGSFLYPREESAIARVTGVGPAALAVPPLAEAPA